jgi:hypothetical protein
MPPSPYYGSLSLALCLPEKLETLGIYLNLWPQITHHNNLH